MQPVRPQLLGLLQACKEEPDEDTSRLVLADWLAEQGVTKLPELIRLKCRSARMSYRERQHQRVDARLQALARACEEEWLRPLRERGLAACFTRGLLHVDAPLKACQRSEVRQLADTELWAWVESLSIGGARWGLPGLQELLPSGLCQGLTSFTLGGIVLGEPEAEALGQADMPLLRELHLYLHRPNAEGLKRLARAPLAKQLVTLSISAGGSERNGIRSTGAPALAAGSWDRLGRLNLHANRIGDAGAQALLTSTGLPRLTTLLLSGNEIGEDMQRALRERFGSGVTF